jgi:hypothetical protein
MSRTNPGTPVSNVSRNASNLNLNLSYNNNNHASSINFDRIELEAAMSCRNSFINYFENKYNIPDIKVSNILDAVNYIVYNENK